MTTVRNARDVLDAELLDVRARLLEIAATLDRIDRGAGSVGSDPRIQQVREAIDVLAGADSDRAERIQMIFSRAYNKDWQQGAQGG